MSLSYPYLSSCPSPGQTYGTTPDFSDALDLATLDFRMNGVKQYVLFGAWRVSPCIMLLRRVHMVVWASASFLFRVESSALCHRPPFAYPLIHTWTSGLFLPFVYYEQCFYEHLWASSEWTHFHFYWGAYQGGRVPGLCAYCYVRSFKELFQSSCTLLHSHKECMRVPFPPCAG